MNIMIIMGNTGKYGKYKDMRSMGIVGGMDNIGNNGTIWEKKWEIFLFLNLNFLNWMTC